MTEDLRTVCELMRRKYPHAIVAVAGKSLGGAAAPRAFAAEAFASDRPQLRAT
jgi:alpha-beta hydrolase superfamily lysophospholipase